ncbi:MAG TPA: dihydrodipicolinate synthase family protein [Rectinemataceae bacterium]|nr:dihydrodipicolinate synthase family protein [Rectinemataceae bacterium]
MKKGKNFFGIIPPVVTPFTKKGEVDEDLFRKEIRHLLDCGVHGLSVGGSTGEGAVLADEELVRLINIIHEENTRKVPVIAGIIRTSIQMAVATGLAAKGAGADALLITPVFYNILVPDAKGNEAFYRAISDAVDLPIIIYNVVPQNEVTSDALKGLLKIKNVIGIKQSVGGLPGFYDMEVFNGEKAMIYSATDEMIFSTFELGADGAISAILSLFPKLCVRMWELAKAGKHEEGQKLQDSIYPVWKIIRGPQFPARMKEALRILGRNCGYSRSPMTKVAPEQIDMMKKMLVGLKDE